MRRFQALILTFLIAAGVAVSQKPDSATFDVASVRQSPPQADGLVFFGAPQGGPETSSPVQITWNNATLRNILIRAYDIQIYQLESPEWVTTERYDIQAKVPEGATKVQVREMWKNLLKERFGLKVHQISKEFTVQELSVTKGGSKMQPTSLPPDAQEFSALNGPPKSGKDGLPEMNGTGGIVMITLNNGSPTGRLKAKGLSLPEIATRLGNLMDQPVLDKTGLAGKYDFTLEFTPDLTGMRLPPPPPGGAAPSAPSEPGSNVPTAIEKQLGLKLTKAKGQLPVVVVDHIEKVPTEN